MDTLKRHKEIWEDLGKLDPLWAVLTDPAKKHGKWGLEEFFGTGERDIALLMSATEALGLPAHRDTALDFGCGVGRISRALAKYFRHCSGVDIAESMIAKAKELNSDLVNCSFVVNESDNLNQFSSGSFDLVYTHLVLQHLPNQATMKGYIREFLRLLKPQGLIVFQLPSSLPNSSRIGLKRRLYHALRAIGISKSFLHHRLGISPAMTMTYVPEAEMVAFVEAIGSKVLDVKRESWPDGVESREYFISK